MTLHETLGRVLCTDSGPARIVWEEGGHLSSSMEAFGLRSGGIYVKAILDAFAVLEHREPPPEQPPSSGNDSSPSIAPTHV